MFLVQIPIVFMQFCICMCIFFTVLRASQCNSMAKLENNFGYLFLLWLCLSLAHPRQWLLHIAAHGHLIPLPWAPRHFAVAGPPFPVFNGASERAQLYRHWRRLRLRRDVGVAVSVAAWQRVKLKDLLTQLTQPEVHRKIYKK